MIEESFEPKAPYADCQTCPLREQPFVAGSGAEQPRIIIVGEAPGAKEVKTGVPFIGPSGKLLDAVLKHNDIDRSEEVYVTNTVLCRPEGNRTPTAVEIRHCKQRLIEEIKAKRPDAVLALGAPASKTLLDTKQGITMLRIGGAKLSPLLADIPVVATFHPAAILRDPSKMPSLQSDVAKVAKTKVRVEWEHTIHTVHDDVEKAIVALDEQVRDPEYINGLPMLSLDIENAPPFDRHRPDMLCYGISNKMGTASVYTKRVVDDPRFQVALNEHFKQPYVVWAFQFGKYDVQYMWSNGVPRARVDEDTGLAHYATDERKGTHDLEQIATEILGAPMYKQQAKIGLEDDESLGDLPPEDLYAYNAADADVTLRLLDPLHRAIAQDSVEDVYYGLLIPGSDALAAMEYRGFAVDTAMIDELDERLTRELADKEKELQRWVKNPRSPQQLVKAFNGVKEGALSDTQALTLKTLILSRPKTEEAEFATQLLAYRKDQKTLSTYVRGMKKRMIRGRIYSRFNLHGTETGRLSSRNPNLQNVTQGALRGMFTASEGNTLINADYKGIELRTAALQIGSPWLLDAFKNNRDIHREVAKQLFGDEYTDRQYRDGKTVTFGIFFDRHAPAIAAALHIGVGQAQTMIDNWKERCPELEEYFEATRNEIQANSYLRSHFGRVRRFWLLTRENALDVYREGYNFRIQSWAGDIMLKSLIRLHQEGIVSPVVSVHDSASFDEPESLSQERTDYIRSVMEDTSDYIDVPTPIDVKEGFRWQ